MEASVLFSFGSSGSNWSPVMRDITYTMVHIKELIELDYWNNILRFSSKEDKIQNFESE